MNSPNDDFSGISPVPPATDEGFDPIAPAAPIESSTKTEDENFIPGGRAVSAENGWAWIAGAFVLFARKPWFWIGIMLAYVVAFFVLTFVPFIGSIITMFIPFLFTAGVVYSCDLLEREGSFAFNDIFIGFKRQLGSLLLIGLIVFGFTILLILITLPFLGTAIYGFITGVQSSSVAGTGVGIGMLVIGALIIVIGSLVCAMGIWFAPALIIMHKIEPIRAIKMSFSACFKNLLPGIIFFIIVFGLTIIAAIPFGLGFLVMWPIFFISYYTTYRDIFLGKERLVGQAALG
ncbi:MAG: hypothetical protein LBB65_07005 [Burkholderiales bacterium]|jgi:hypothetical protein|nr:hypothetical protein [Burkholderiales bacterium]